MSAKDILQSQKKVKITSANNMNRRTFTVMMKRKNKLVLTISVSSFFVFFFKLLVLFAKAHHQEGYANADLLLFSSSKVFPSFFSESSLGMLSATALVRQAVIPLFPKITSSVFNHVFELWTKEKHIRFDLGTTISCNLQSEVPYPQLSDFC